MGAYNRRPRLKNFDYKGIHRYFVTVCTHERMPLFDNDDIFNTSLETLKKSSSELGFKVWAFCFMPDHVHLLVEGNREDSDLRRFVSVFKQKSAFYCGRIMETAEHHGDHDVGQGFSPERKALEPWPRQQPFRAEIAGLKPCARSGSVGHRPGFQGCKSRVKTLRYEPCATSGITRMAGLKPCTTGKHKLWQTSYYDHVLRQEEDIMAVARYIFENPMRKNLVEHCRDYAKMGSIELPLERFWS